MSFSPSLRASARSAYRNLCRAASSTFRGDDIVLRAFRQKMRQDALLASSITDSKLYQEQEQLACDVADVLRKNIVQGIKVTENGLDTWRLHIRPDTELGSNDTVKPIEDIASSRSIRKRVVTSLASSPDTVKLSHVPIYYSALKKAHKARTVPLLREEDLEESFVRGSGPGGQSINKTENNVQLLHKPTGTRVSCQETRSLSTNRKLARRLLLEKLDQHENPGLSRSDLQRAKQRERERRRRKKAKKRVAATASD